MDVADQISQWAKMLLDKIASYQLTGEMLTAGITWLLDKGATLLTAVGQPAVAAYLTMIKAALAAAGPILSGGMDLAASMLNDLIAYVKTIVLDYLPKVLKLVSLTQSAQAIAAPAAA